MVVELFTRILLSLAIGALIGIERERRGKGELVEGLRTFMLASLLGTLSGYFSTVLQTNLLFFLTFIFIGLLAILGYQSKVRKKHYGLTTEIAFLLTFFIGLILYFDTYPFLLSISLGILLTLILVTKESMHRFAKHVTEKEIWDAIIFGILAFIILPLLPEGYMGPFNAFNPFLTWLSIVIVLSISFAGYIAMKVFGAKKGLAITGFFGGLASSTGVSIAMAEDVRRNQRILYSAIFAVLIASSTMFLRTTAISTFINPEVAVRLILPLFILGFTGYMFGYYYWKKVLHEKATVNIGSPLALKPALKFGLFFTIILFVSTVAKNFFGPTGIYFIALIAGLIEVDAITITIASLALTSISPIFAVKAIMVALLSNTFSKWFLIKWMGTKEMAEEVGKSFAVLILFGLFMLLILSTI